MTALDAQRQAQQLAGLGVRTETVERAATIIGLVGLPVEDVSVRAGGVLIRWESEYGQPYSLLVPPAVPGPARRVTQEHEDDFIGE